MTQPPPLPPFGNARDVDTEPGIGAAENLALKRENMRLRKERNEARATLSQALTQSAPGTDGVTVRFGRTKKVAFKFGEYTTLLSAAGLIARFIAKKFPESAELVEGLLQLVGL